MRSCYPHGVVESVSKLDPDRLRVLRVGSRALYRALALALFLAAAACSSDMRDWNVPTDPRDKAAYDHAHAIVLPDSVPKPVPFSFVWAHLKALLPGTPSVAEQYFDHLCANEAGEFIFQTVENVEGLYQYRLRRVENIYNAADFDRYGTEETTGIGYADVVEHYDFERKRGNTRSAFVLFVDPSTERQYEYLEQPFGKSGYQRYFRNPDPNTNRYFQHKQLRGVSVTNDRPFIVDRKETDTLIGRYGYTWRGIRRARDREYGVGGGEYIVLELPTQRVLAVKRNFVLSGRSRRSPSGILWSNAYHCDESPKRRSFAQFIEKVLRPVPGVNDEYLAEHPGVELP